MLTLSCIANLKDPNNYIKYIRHWDDFVDELQKEFKIAAALSQDIKKIHKQMRSNSMKISNHQRVLQVEKNSTSVTCNESVSLKKTLVIEPENLLFTIRDEEIPGVAPNLVFERQGKNGESITQYLYLNQSYKPFLIYICQKFEVVIYSRLKTSLLNQLLTQIKTMVPGLYFSAVIGSSCCLNTKLVYDSSIYETGKEDHRGNENHQKRRLSNFSLEVKLKNVDKIIKKRGKENLIFLDNNLYSYVN